MNAERLESEFLLRARRSLSPNQQQLARLRQRLNLPAISLPRGEGALPERQAQSSRASATQELESRYDRTSSPDRTAWSQAKRWIASTGKWVAVAVGAGGAGYWSNEPSSSKVERASASQVVEVPRDPAQLASATLEGDGNAVSEPEVTEPSTTAPKLRPPKHGRVTSRAATELEVLHQARQALANGKPGKALELMTGLDRSASRGFLLERGVVKVLAYCALGRSRTAGELARQLNAAHVDSVYQERLAHPCEPGRDSPPASGEGLDPVLTDSPGSRH